MKGQRNREYLQREEKLHTNAQNEEINKEKWNSRHNERLKGSKEGEKIHKEDKVKKKKKQTLKKIVKICTVGYSHRERRSRKRENKTWEGYEDNEH